MKVFRLSTVEPPPSGETSMKQGILLCLLALMLVAGCTGARDVQDPQAQTSDRESRERFTPEREGLRRSYDSLSPRQTRSQKRTGEWNVRPPMDSNN
jgi:hypothetical protein